MAAVAVLASAAILAGTGVAVADRQGDRPPRPEPVEVTITGDVEGLHPGVDAVLELTITNPYRFDVQVRDLDVVVTDASPDCSASALVVEPAPTGLVIAGRGEGNVTVPIAMPRSVPDACQGAVFPLSYTATAIQAGH